MVVVDFVELRSAGITASVLPFKASCYPLGTQTGSKYWVVVTCLNVLLEHCRGTVPVTKSTRPYCSYSRYTIITGTRDSTRVLDICTLTYNIPLAAAGASSRR
eukprot:SAG11_NODE_12612_length_694_cov_1.860504_1_plen_103_part_00